MRGGQVAALFLQKSGNKWQHKNMNIASRRGCRAGRTQKPCDKKSAATPVQDEVIPPCKKICLLELAAGLIICLWT